MRALLIALLLPAAFAADTDAAEQVRKLQPQIDNAITRGVGYLLKQQQRDGSWGFFEFKLKSGQTGLTVYTLLKCGLAPDHPAIRRGLRYLELTPPRETYTAACHLQAFAAAGDPAHRGVIKRILTDLISWQQDGTWSYPYKHDGSAWLVGSRDADDLSNTQYAALGLRAAEQAGLQVPKKLWLRVLGATLELQEKPTLVDVEVAPGETGTGKASVAGFVYKTGNAATGSMTAGGIAVLEICREALDGKLPRKLAMRADDAVQHALAWLDHHWTVSANPGRTGWLYYYLYGLERVGALLPTEKIGGHHWYLEGARFLVAKQGGGGSWSNKNGECDTCWALLFLERATAAATGEGVDEAGVHAAEDPRFPVRMRAIGDADLELRITGFSKAVLEDYGAGPTVEGLRIARVEYRVDEDVVATLDGDPGVGWAGDPFPAGHEFTERGSYRVWARVHLVDPDAPRATTEPSYHVDSPGFTLEVEQLLAGWMLPAAAASASNLVQPGPATVRASSEHTEAFAARLAADGLQSTAWLSAAGDEAPTLTLTLPRPVKANTITLGQAAARLSSLGAHDRARVLQVQINDRDEYRVTLADDELQPAELRLPKTLRVTRLRITVVERAPGSKHRGLLGFSEVGLELRGDPSPTTIELR